MRLFSLITATVLALSTSAYAQPIDLVNSGAVGSVRYKILENMAANSNGVFSEITNFGTCAEVVNYMNNTTKPTVTSWDILRHGTSKDTSCDFVNEDNFITIYGKAYFNVCSLSNKPENTLDRFRNGKAKFGVIDYFTDLTQAKELLKGVDSNATVVRYKAGPDALAALEIGEIDFIFTTRQRENMSCVLTTNPNPTTASASAIEYFNNSFATSSLVIIMVGVNVDRDQILEIAEASSQSEQWKNEFSHYDTSFFAIDRNTQYQELTTIINDFKQSIVE
jgi:hypothetical protein